MRRALETAEIRRFERATRKKRRKTAIFRKTAEIRHFPIPQNSAWKTVFDRNP